MSELTFRDENSIEEDEIIPLFSVALRGGKHSVIGVYGIPGPGPDPGMIGLLLADAARTFAMAYRDLFEQDPDAALQEIQKIFNREIEDPSADMRGALGERLKH